MQVRRVLLAIAIAASAIIVAACGSSAKKTGTASPTATALSYFPSDAPVVAIADTAPGGPADRQLQAIQKQVPAVVLLRTALFAQLARAGVDYNRDVRPLLGNPIAFGAATGTLHNENSPFLLAWQTHNAAALKRLVSAKDGMTPAGSHDGAQLFSAGHTVFATDGPLVLLSNSTAAVRAALDRHAAGTGFTTTAYHNDTAGLPSAGLVSVVGNLQSELAQPSAAQARRIPWVAAIRGYGVSASVTGSSVALRFHVDTGGRTLSPSQLPIAGGATAPGLAGILPVAVGVRDPAQVWRFIRGAEQAADPGSYSKTTRQLAQLKRRSGVDVNALLGDLSGDLAITSDAHTTIGRVQVSDPGRMRTMVAKLVAAAGHGRTLGGQRERTTRLGGGLYRVDESDGTRLIVGVVGDHLLVGRGTPQEVRAFARTPSTRVSGASGALSFRIALANLVRLTATHPVSAAEQQFLARLGDVTGSVRSAASGLTGTATLALR